MRASTWGFLPSLVLNEATPPVDTSEVDVTLCPRCYSQSLVIEGYFEPGAITFSQRGHCLVCKYVWAYESEAEAATA